MYRILLLTCACWCSCLSGLTATLTFIAQPASSGGDNTWFNAVNWFTTDTSGNLLPAGRVPQADEAAVITGTVDLQASGVRVATLVATNNASITNGTLAAENLQLLGGSSFNGVTVNVLTSLNVAGTNCTLNASAMNILSIAAGILQALPPATASSLILTQGSILSASGALTLGDGAQLIGGGLPQSKLVVQLGGLLISSNAAEVVGSAAGHLVIDNSGVIRADAGSLVFSNGIDWQCSAGLGEFRAAGPSSTLTFLGPFHVDSGVTDLFTGIGTNKWLGGATIDGVAQVSALNAASQLAGPGALEIAGSVTGVGTVHMLGTTNQGGAAIWDSGQLSLPGVAVDPGATLLIQGAAGASCQLAGCTVTNLGQCIFNGADLNFSEGAVFNNEPAAVLSIQADGTFSSSSGSGVLNNFGTLQKLSAGVTGFIITNAIQGPDFNNAGLVDLRGGQLNLLGGASSGEFRQAPGTLCWFWGGPYSLNSGSTFTGSSAVRLSRGSAPAKWLLNDSITIAQFELGADGVMDSSGVPTNSSIQIGTLVTHDNALITNGTFQIGQLRMLDETSIASATLNIASSMNVNGTNCTLAASTLNNAGSCNLAGGKLTLAQDAVINNQAGATFVLQSNVSIVLAPSGGASAFNNAGTFVMSAPGLCNVGADFSNSGQFDVQSGTLAFQGAWNQVSGTTMIQPGATLGGTNLTVLSGTVSGTGAIAANLVNVGGTLSPGSPVGILSIGVGQQYQQSVGANLAIQLGGIAAPTQFGQLSVGGGASLDGQLSVSLADGFTPQPGQTFQILTAGAVTGRFARISAPSQSGTAWIARYSTNSLELVFAGNENLARPQISGSSLNLPISTLAGVNYQVQATDRLNPANWQNIATFQGDGTVKTISETLNQGSRFYRVLEQ